MKYSTINVAAMLMALCFTACNEAAPDALGDKVLLNFSTSLNNENWTEESRADHWSIDGTEFMAGDQIYVDVWELQTNESVVNPNLMNSQLATYNGVSWDYSPKKYLVNTAKKHLVYSAYSNNATISEKCNVGSCDATSGYRTLTFSNCGDWVKDVLVAPVVQTTRDEVVAANGVLPLKFYHIMARLKVLVKYVPVNNNSSSMELKKITFRNHTNGGKFIGFDNEGKPIWSDLSYTGNGVYESNSDNGWTINATDSEGDFFDIPDFTRCQIPFSSPMIIDENSRKLIMIVVCEIDGNELTYEKEFDNLSLNAGETTKFNITFTGSEMKIRVVTDSNTDWWKDESDYSINFGEVTVTNPEEN